MAYGVSIASVATPDFLRQLSVALHQRRVQAVGGRLLVVSSLFTIIIILNLGLRHTFVEIAGRGQQQVFAVSLVHPLRQHGGVEDDWEQLVAESVNSLTTVQRQSAGIHLMQYTAQIFLVEIGYKLLCAVVVIDAV